MNSMVYSTINHTYINSLKLVQLAIAI